MKNDFFFLFFPLMSTYREKPTLVIETQVATFYFLLYKSSGMVECLFVIVRIFWMLIDVHSVHIFLVCFSCWHILNVHPCGIVH